MANSLTAAAKVFSNTLIFSAAKNVSRFAMQKLLTFSAKNINVRYLTNIENTCFLKVLKTIFLHNLIICS